MKLFIGSPGSDAERYCVSWFSTKVTAYRLYELSVARPPVFSLLHVLLAHASLTVYLVVKSNVADIIFPFRLELLSHVLSVSTLPSQYSPTEYSALVFSL